MTKFGLSYIGFSFIQLLILFVFYELPLSLEYFLISHSSQINSNIQNVFVLVSMLVILTAFINYSKTKMWADWHWENIWNNKRIILGILILMLMFGFLMPNIAPSHNQQLLDKIEEKLPFFITIFSEVVFGPICEEIIFRAGIFEYALALFPKLAFFFSVLMFASVHMLGDMINLLDWLVYLVMSLMFTFTYFKTRKVEASIAVHMLWNLCAIVFGI